MRLLGCLTAIYTICTHAPFLKMAQRNLNLTYPEEFEVPPYAGPAEPEVRPDPEATPGQPVLTLEGPRMTFDQHLALQAFSKAVIAFIRVIPWAQVCLDFAPYGQPAAFPCNVGDPLGGRFTSTGSE